MIVEPPKSSREALHQAMLQISNLYRKFPGAKVGEILDELDTVELIWSKQDPEQFPFNVLLKEFSAIKAEIQDAYSGDLDLPVQRGSRVFDLINRLEVRIGLYNEQVILDPVYRSLEERLHRIEGLLPARNHAFRDLLGEIRPSLDPGLRKRLETALDQFSREEYELVISECGRAEGILFSRFKTFLATLAIGELPPQTGAAINLIRDRIKNIKDGNGLPLAKSGRLEVLVLSMFEVLHYFRNLAAHDRAEEVAEEGLPEWQVQRRECFTQKPEYARLALLLTIQITLELQALLGQGKN